MNAKSRITVLAVVVAVSAVPSRASVTDQVADILQSLAEGKTGEASSALDALFSGSKVDGGKVRKTADDQDWGGSTGRPPKLPDIKMPPRQDPPKQDPPRKDPPRQDPPKQDPPRKDPPRQDPPALPPSKIPGTTRPG